MKEPAAPEAARRALAVRRGAGWFELGRRGLLEVRGGERLRWLDGMVTADIRKLEPGTPRSGCAALALTPKGRIVADLYVLAFGDRFWLECDGAAREALQERLSRSIVADDVLLVDRSDEFARFSVEGPEAGARLEALGARPLPAERGAFAEVRLAGVEAVVAAFGWSGEAAFQLLVPAAGAAAVREALARAGQEPAWLRGDREVLEVLRVEAGIPRYGAELGEDTLPAEARMMHAVAPGKGCYAGQEVVERMRSRGRVGHLLVGLSVAAPESAPVGAALLPGEPPAPGGEQRPVGEVTSAVISAVAGSIALGFVRSGFDAPGTSLRIRGFRGEAPLSARVAPLPFVLPGTGGRPQPAEGPARGGARAEAEAARSPAPGSGR